MKLRSARYSELKFEGKGNSPLMPPHPYGLIGYTSRLTSMSLASVFQSRCHIFLGTQISYQTSNRRAGLSSGIRTTSGHHADPVFDLGQCVRLKPSPDALTMSPSISIYTLTTWIIFVRALTCPLIYPTAISRSNVEEWGSQRCTRMYNFTHVFVGYIS